MSDGNRTLSGPDNPYAHTEDPGYDCAYCGSSMIPLRRRQPVYTEARCWCCYAEHLEKRVRELSASNDRMAKALIGIGGAVLIAVSAWVGTL